MTLSPSPEFALLLDAVAPLGTPRADTRAWDGARWARTLEIAEWHRLSPILFRHLESLEGVPPDVHGEAEQAYLANAARNLFVEAMLDRILDALKAADVPAMLLKGAALLKTSYPDRGRRELLDIDLLAPVDALDRGSAALLACGFHTEPADEDAESPVSRRASHHHDPALISDDELLAVELHHHIAMLDERAHFEIAGLWERARPGDGGAPHRLPSAEDLLLHVCLHFTRNRLGGSHIRRGSGGALGQIADIAAIAAHDPPDWDAVVGHARAYRLDARVFMALFAARRLGVDVPACALGALRPDGFDARVGERFVALRVLRHGQELPVRGARWIVAPPREALVREWSASPDARLSLARAYARRALAQAPAARRALRRPWALVHDYRLNGQITALERRVTER